MTVYELDTPDMLEFKASVVSDAAPNENATRVPIPIDLRDDWPAALHDAGFRDDVPTAWVLEGLLMYLTDEDVDALMTRVGDLSAGGSALGATVTTVDFASVMDDAPIFQDSPSARGVAEAAPFERSRRRWMVSATRKRRRDGSASSVPRTTPPTGPVRSARGPRPRPD